METGVAQSILTWSHTFCLGHERCFHCSIFALFFCKAEQGQQTETLNTHRADCIFSRRLPLPQAAITVIVPGVLWIYVYSEACYSMCCSLLYHNSLTVFGMNQPTAGSRLSRWALCDPPLPVLFGHPLIQFPCRCSCQSRASHIWRNALWSPSIFSFFL